MSSKPLSIVSARTSEITRFGYEYLEYFFKQYNVEIVKAFKTEKELLEELIQEKPRGLEAGRDKSAVSKGDRCAIIRKI